VSKVSESKEYWVAREDEEKGEGNFGRRKKPGFYLCRALKSPERQYDGLFLR
jgi:hypothetical protein